MWIMPDYYLAAATQCLFTLGANTDGTALLDIHHSKNNVSSLSRKEFSIQARATHAEFVCVFGEFTIRMQSVLKHHSHGVL